MMKNFLIGTTALIGAALVAATAQAEDPKVLVGGVIDFQGGYVDEDLDQFRRDFGFRNDTEVSIAVQGRADNGLGYGAVMDLEADVSEDVNNEGVNAARTYVFLDGSFGRVEMGSNTGSAEALAVEADNIARGTGGIDGDWIYFATQPGTAFISTPALPGEHGNVFAFGDESTYNATKVTYYTPRFSGFQVGVSYAPDYDDRGQELVRSKLNQGGNFDNVVEAGVNYEGQWDAFGIAAAATGAVGDSKGAGTTGFGTTEDLRAWNAGGAVSFSGLSVAGSYGDWDDSLGQGTDSDYYTAGAAYDFGPFGASVTWLDSTVETNGAGDNDFQNLVIGADYMVAPGLTPYAEVSLFDAETDTAGLADNDGTVVILGTELAF